MNTGRRLAKIGHLNIWKKSGNEVGFTTQKIRKDYWPTWQFIEKIKKNVNRKRKTKINKRCCKYLCTHWWFNNHNLGYLLYC